MTTVCVYCGAEVKLSEDFCLNCGNRVESTVLHERYRLLDIIGQGGMGTIYKAQDVKLGNRFVAIKELTMPSVQTQEEFDKATRLFEQEALLLAHLSHPALPDIYDHFSQDRHWYFVMKYILGETLAQHLLTIPNQHISLEDALDIGIRLCEVLEYLHAQMPPVIFGDLKPQNIMLTPEGHLYLIDFGIARFFEEIPSDDKNFVSHGYSPPEQYRHTHLSPRADIYSLGATLYQLLSGHNPGKDNSTFTPLQLGYQQWAKDFEALIQHMLALDEQQRPESVTLVKQILQSITTQLALQSNTSLWGTAAPVGGATYGGYASDWGKTYAPHAVSTSSIDEIPPLPSTVVAQNVRLGLSGVHASLAWFPSNQAPSRDHASLAWSLDGAHLAAISDEGLLHIYAWPTELVLLPQEDETLTPMYTLSLDNIGASLESDIVAKNEQSVQFHTVSSDFYRTVASINVNASYCITWSPDGTSLIVAREKTLYKIHVFAKTVDMVLDDVESSIALVAWSSDRSFIATGYDRYPSAVHVWDISTGKKVSNNGLAVGYLTALRWSADSRYIAFAGGNTTVAADSPTNVIVQVCEALTGREVCRYREHQWGVSDIIWSADGTYIVSCGGDSTIHVWDATSALKLRSLEGHTHSVHRLTFLDKGRLLASLAADGTVYIWSTETWTQVESFKIAYNQWGTDDSIVAFNPVESLIAVFGINGSAILYKIDVNQLYLEPAKRSGVQYTNAKVVLIGDSGVGKSGLGLVLSHQSFAPTESTHGRVVWTFSKHENRMEDGNREIRETLLWDLAGQPGYRLIHQLHLSEVAVALVIFDAHSETDPFGGIAHWVRALRTAQSVRGHPGAMKLLLVQSRIDRGGVRVTHDRIDDFIRQLGIESYFETSAKEGTNIAELSRAIEHAIHWDKLPKVTSTDLFQRIKSFLIAEKQAERLLSTADDLYRSFLSTWNALDEHKASTAEFTTGIKLLEATGMIRRLSFGNFVLLQPELLDTYASALVNAARREPDGLGSIAEESVNTASFPIPIDERIHDPDQEKLLLIAMVQDLLSYEIALREQGEDGPYLIFPSESTRENPELPNPENASVVFTFEGPVPNIYATLAVRLSHAGFFRKKELWKNAIVYDALPGGVCGLWLKIVEDGKGELTLFFDAQTSSETSFLFEDYVHVHLQRKALPQSVKSRRIFRCQCGFAASEQLIRMRIERSFTWFSCPVCSSYVDLRDSKERLKNLASSQVVAIDQSADKQRARATAQSIVQGKQETDDFDVFLCYNPNDQSAIIDIGEKLKELGILPWLNLWELQPGRSWQRVLEQQIGKIKSAAVFVGKDGFGPWQQQELEAFLREFVRRDCPVIPVILTNASQQPVLPIFLEGLRWVDFRADGPLQDMNAMEQLVWGITGKRKVLR